VVLLSFVCLESDDASTTRCHRVQQAALQVCGTHTQHMINNNDLPAGARSKMSQMVGRDVKPELGIRVELDPRRGDRGKGTIVSVWCTFLSSKLLNGRG
jgi:hypothetical protein